jgi:hypothetical protein
MDIPMQEPDYDEEGSGSEFSYSDISLLSMAKFYEKTLTIWQTNSGHELMLF